MAGTAQVPKVPDLPCAKHAQQIAELYRTVNALHVQILALQNSLERETVERRQADEESMRVRKEIMDALGTVPDPIRGIEGSGIKGYIYTLLMQQPAPSRQSLASVPEDTGNLTRADLIERVATAERNAKTTHTKLVGTLIGAIIGGIVAAATTIMSMLGK